MKSYQIILWNADGAHDGFNCPLEELKLETTGSTCAVFKNGKALGGGTITERSRETVIAPPQLRVTYEGTFQGERGRFTMVCKASEDEINAELAEDTLTFA